MKFLLATILFLTTLLSCDVAEKKQPVPEKMQSAIEKTQPNEFPVISYDILNTKEFNNRVDLAVKNKEQWVYSAILVAFKYRKISDTPFVSIFIKNNSGEESLSSIITTTEDGYRDDSVRGGWRQLHLERKNSASAWYVKEIRQAHLCGRMHAPKEFQTRLCP